MAHIAVGDEIVNPEADGLADPIRPVRTRFGVSKLWHQASVRWQILATFTIINLIAAIVAGVVIVYNAQRAAEVEIASSMRLAETLIRQFVEQPRTADSPSEFLNNLALQVTPLRHVRVFVTGARGSLTSLTAAEEGAVLTGIGTRVPRWFSSFIHTGDVRREIRIGLNGQQIGSVMLVGNATDEIAEVWRDTLDLALIGAILNVIIFAMLCFVLGQILSPLTSLADGLRKLERGELLYRLSLPTVRELRDIAIRFNALADRLGAARADNARLTRRLVTLQDDERRYVATELHDEMGPCLFGIRANVASLEQIAAKLPAAAKHQMHDRITTLGEITDKIQTLNRRLLTRMRPMALGHVPLSEVISGLIAEFERLNSSPKLSLSLGALAHSYGDTIDLTIYRCVQEGLTNAVRHAEAKNATIELTEQPAGDHGIEAPMLRIAVSDDGRGFDAGARRGFGLTGMEERVRAIGGQFNIMSKPEQGTYLVIEIPIEDSQARSSNSAVSRRPA